MNVMGAWLQLAAHLSTGGPISITSALRQRASAEKSNFGVFDGI
ncbi:MAG: hypothetical protein ABIT83_06460 [Massilia sp.]